MTSANHTSQEMVCSKARTQRACEKASCNTLTPVRITTRANITGIATCKTTPLSCRSKTARAANTRQSRTAGKSTPSMSLRPNQTER